MAKSKPSPRMKALTEALSGLSAPPLEVVLRLAPIPEGARLKRRLINTVVATDKVTVIKVYQEEPEA